MTTRVLIVDDDPTATDGLRALLRLDGYEVIALNLPAVAVERLAQERFDVVITDLEMPRVHGVEVVRAARASRPDLPVFVVTAYASSPAAEAALVAGAARVFDKPLDYDLLAAALVDVMSSPARDTE